MTARTGELPTAHIELTRKPGTHWSLLPFPPCPICAGALEWFDCDLTFGCAECPDCGARYSVTVRDREDV
jgi:hypothetical protein